MNNKEMSWVAVFDEDKDNYVPAQYETKDIYQGKDCLPMYDNKEECEQWCFNYSQEFYVDRWIKAIKYLSDENNQPSLKPGDYIQIKEIVDGIGIGYIDDKKHLLFNTKYLNDYLSSNFELMPEDFNPIHSKSLDVNKKFVDNTSDKDLNNLMKEFDNYQVKESVENKSLKWWMSLTQEQQVEIGLKYDEPTFNLTIRAIMFEYEQSCRIKS